jgi:hypothetical protein
VDLTCSVLYQTQSVEDEALKPYVHWSDSYGWKVEQVAEAIRLFKNDKPAYLEQLADLPEVAGYALYAAAKRDVYDLNHSLFVMARFGPFWEGQTNVRPIPPPEYVAGIPMEAFDQHTREGKSSLLYWNKASAFLRSLELSDPLKKLGMLVFQREGALLDRVAPAKWSMESESENNRAELASVGWTPEKLQQFHQLEQHYGEELWAGLNKARVRIVEGKK